MEHRFYDSAVGRFLNPDPIGLAGGLNLYAYCAGDPVGAVDPSGLDPFDANEFSEEEIIHGGLLTRRLMSAGFHGRDMAYANSLHQQLGMPAFRSGNRPLAMDAFNIHQTVGQIGAGGPMVAGAACGVYRAGSPMGRGPNLWQRFTGWWGRVFSRKERVVRIMSANEKATVMSAGRLVPSSSMPFGMTRVAEPNRLNQMVGMPPFNDPDKYSWVVTVTVRKGWRKKYYKGGAVHSTDIVPWAFQVDVDRMAQFQIGLPSAHRVGR